MKNFFTLLAAAGLALAAASAQAVPSFARQANLDCVSCHLSWLELTPTGRQFKLAGYTWGQRSEVPLLAGMLQVSRTQTRKPGGEEADKDRDIVLQEAALFAAGKLSQHSGLFAEVAYEGVERKTAIDAVDVRYARQVGEGDTGTIYGFTLNNNPTIQDVYNTVPAWGFPFAASEVAPSPNASTMIESLGQQVVGLGAYAQWHKTIYAEVSAYRTADRAFSLFRAGHDHDESAVLQGLNPYWRLALQHEWEGKHSAMVGMYGMNVRKYPDSLDPTGPTDRFRDIGFDAQYQYVGPTDHRYSAQLNYIREKQSWRSGAASNDTNRLSTFRAKATYYYLDRYGINVAWFNTRGTSDAALYDTGEPVSGSANASPDTRGHIVELNWLPRRDLRLVLQYTGYDRFNGAKSDYDGFGRNARDNNSLFLLLWYMI